MKKIEPAVAAAVKRDNGVLRLYVNDKAVDPMLYFGNTEWKGHEDHVAPEIALCKDVVNLYTFVLHFPVIPKGYEFESDEKRYEQLIRVMDYLLEADPHALIIPRVPLYPYDYKWWYDNRPEELMTYADGSKSIPSLASDEWYEQAIDALDKGIDFLLGHPKYKDHIIGFHPTYNSTGEWFYESYREKGVDFSPCNRMGFVKYLKDKYKEVEALNQAVGRQYQTFEEIEIPEIPGNLPNDPSPAVFLRDRLVPEFYAYINSVNTGRMMGIADFIKEKTYGKSLVMYFYGYNWELCDPKSGHCCLTELLRHGNIDLLASPISYQDRAEGGVMSFMAPIDTIAAHDVLWMMEDDTRTFRALDMTEQDASFNPTIRDKKDTMEIHKRNFSDIITRKIGLWWMDLWGSGWLEDKDLWENIKVLTELYKDSNAKFQPEVAFVVDEKAAYCLNNPSYHAIKMLYQSSAKFYRTGTCFGLYSMQDIVDNLLPASVKLVVMLNALDINAEKAEAIRKNLYHGGRTVLYCYSADGYHGQYTKELLGFPLYAAEAAAPLEMIFNGKRVCNDVICSPVFYAENDIEVIAEYTALKKPGFVCKTQPDHTVMFYGGMGVDTDVIRYAAKKAGCHIYSSDDFFLTANEEMVFVYANRNLSSRISLPCEATVTDLFDRQEIETYLENGNVYFDYHISKGQTKYFAVHAK